MREGENAAKLFFLSKGEAIVQLKDRKKELITARVIYSGALFGEIALISNSKRTATVKTLNYCTCASLYREEFQDLCLYYPDILNKLKL